VSDETVANVLRRNGVAPSGGRKPTLTWAEFIDAHKETLVATDFFTVEVVTPNGLICFFVLFFINLTTRRVHLGGITAYPNEQWMKQVARNATMEDWGYLSDCTHLIFDRDSKYCASFQSILESAGIKMVRLPPRSPNLNAFAERFVRSAKEECLSKFVFFSERDLRRAMDEFLVHYHKERNHQGKGNVLLFPCSEPAELGPVRCRERLGGLLKFYWREAA
jgi:putative transposase